MKSKILYILLIFPFFVIRANNNMDILYSKDTFLRDFRIRVFLYKLDKEKYSNRLLLKITPLNDSAKLKLDKGKAELMFGKLKSIEIETNMNKIIFPNDYLYEEIMNDYHLIFTILSDGKMKIKKINLIDNLITNLEKIQLL